MNEKEKAVLDAARGQAGRIREKGVEPFWRTANTNALAPLVIAALDAFPAEAEPQPETVRDVADLRDGDRMAVEFVYRVDDGWFKYNGFNMVKGTSAGAREAVAAGAVTRPPRPEPDPAEVERLAEIVVGAGIQREEAPSMARDLLLLGVRLPRDPS